MGTHQNGLNRFDKEQDAFLRYEADPNSRYGLLSNWISTLYTDKVGVVWIGTGQGVNRFNSWKKFDLVQSDPRNQDGLNDNVVLSITGGDGVLWVGTWGGINKITAGQRKNASLHQRPG